MQLRSAALQGYKRVLDSQVPVLLLRPFLLGLTVVAAWLLLDRPLSAPVAIALNLVTLMVAVGVMGTRMQRALPGEARGAAPEYATREWLSVAASLIVISASQVVLSQHADVVIVGLLVTRSDAALYGVCSQLSGLVGFASSAVLFIATPTIAELFAQKRMDELRKMVRSVAGIGLLGALPGVLGLIVAGNLLLSFYGRSFGAAYPVLVVLTVSQLFISAFGGLGGFIMIMTGQHVVAARIIAGTAVLNIAATLLLTPVLGIMGTAIATLIATLVRSVILATYIWRTLRISMLPRLRFT
jgi:O-antigen/teichoic acid export membrane protein